MKILKCLAVVATIVLALASQSSAAGGLTSSDYTVASTTDEPGLNTGLILKKGRSVTVTAIGSVCPNTGYCVGPDGTSLVNTTQSSYGGFVLPGAPAYGLVGRVGTGPWVQVGSGPTTLSGTGALVFAVNDDYFGDNSGGFMVTVSYKGSGVSRTCWPGWGYGDTNHDHCGPPGLANKPAAPGHSSEDTHGSSNEHSNSPPKGNSGDSGNSSGEGGSHRP